MALVDRVRELVTPVVDAHGVDLYDIDHHGGVLRVSVSAPSPDGGLGGVEVGTIQRISRELARVLDEVDPIPGRYTLEVSSPGLERPLRTPAHFATAMGELITVKLGPHVEGPRRVRGTLVASDEDQLTLETDDGPTTVRLADVTKARTVFEWGPTPKKGRSTESTTESDREATSP